MLNDAFYYPVRSTRGQMFGLWVDVFERCLMFVRCFSACSRFSELLKLWFHRGKVSDAKKIGFLCSPCESDHSEAQKSFFSCRRVLPKSRFLLWRPWYQYTLMTLVSIIVRLFLWRSWPLALIREVTQCSLVSYTARYRNLDHCTGSWGLHTESLFRLRTR